MVALVARVNGRVPEANFAQAGDGGVVYRREIDGLRAIAVVIVILGHADFQIFRGGFSGVDIFFVISGYVITASIAERIERRNFSIIDFYERRARRIIPALLLVMLASLPFSFLWMMPEEFKNFGQSLFATAIFSNNILLAITTDYWNMTSAFKPLLHTWSLGVEEQYYVIWPAIMAAIWRSRYLMIAVVGSLFILSFAVAWWGTSQFPAAAFYILPTRAWELLAGAFVACLPGDQADHRSRGGLGNLLSLAGLAMILSAAVTLDSDSPAAWMLLPVFGSVLVVAFARGGTVAHLLLSNNAMVGIGLISYSLYLWHQPLFALARIHATEPIEARSYVLLIAATFALAYATWRFVEVPFRDRQLVNSRTILAISLGGSLLAGAAGLYLDRTYGMYWRVFGDRVKIGDVDKRRYNSRAYRHLGSRFISRDRMRILVIGNSFARDFINMTTESFNLRRIELIYSDSLVSCISSKTPQAKQELFTAADVIIFASGYDDAAQVAQNCVARDIVWANANGKAIFFVGTKDFGYNLNWIIQVPPAKRANLYNHLPEFVRRQENAQEVLVPRSHFISLLEPVVKNGMVPITDEHGEMISTDRSHLTKFGAVYFGSRVLKGSAYGALVSDAIKKRGQR